MKKFTKKVENFTCFNCSRKIIGNGFTDHCPYCLWSKHVDINPGDRINNCLGKMKPIGVDLSFGANKIKIIFKCQKCSQIKKNKASNQDNMDLIIKLSREPI